MDEDTEAFLSSLSADPALASVPTLAPETAASPKTLDTLAELDAFAGAGAGSGSSDAGTSTGTDTDADGDSSYGDDDDDDDDSDADDDEDVFESIIALTFIQALHGFMAVQDKDLPFAVAVYDIPMYSNRLLEKMRAAIEAYVGHVIPRAVPRPPPGSWKHMVEVILELPLTYHKQLKTVPRQDMDAFIRNMAACLTSPANPAMQRQIFARIGFAMLSLLEPVDAFMQACPFASTVVHAFKSAMEHDRPWMEATYQAAAQADIDAIVVEEAELSASPFLTKKRERAFAAFTDDKSRATKALRK